MEIGPLTSLFVARQSCKTDSGSPRRGPLDHRLEEALTRCRLGEISLEGAGVVPEGVGQDVGGGAALVEMRGEGGPGQTLGQRPPDAPARPGDQDGLPCQIDVHGWPVVCIQAVLKTV